MYNETPATAPAPPTAAETSIDALPAQPPLTPSVPLPPNKRTNLLIWLANILNHLHEPNQMLQRTAELVADTLPVQCWVLVEATCCVAQIGYYSGNGNGSSVSPTTTRQMLAHDLLHRVYHDGETVIVRDLSDESHQSISPAIPTDGSALLIALRHREQPLGVMLVQHAQPDYFRVEDILLLQGVAAQLATALNGLMQYRLEQERREHMYNMLALSRYITTERSFVDLAQMIREHTLRMFGTRRAMLFVEQASGELHQIRALSGRLYTDEALHAEIIQLVSTAWETGHIQKQHMTGVPDLPSLAVPLIFNGQAVGVLVLLGDTATSLDFSANTWSLFTIFTNTIAAACANLLLMHHQQQRTELLEKQVAARTRQLQASRDALRAMVDTLSDGMLLLDAREQVLVVNRAFSETILGRHPRDVVGLPYEAIWDELEQRGLHLTEQRSSDPNAPSGRQMYAIKCRNATGIEGWYLVKRDPIYNADLEIERYLEYWETMA